LFSVLKNKLQKKLQSGNEVKIIRDPLSALVQQVLLVLVFTLSIFASFYAGEYWTSHVAHERDQLVKEKEILEKAFKAEKIKWTSVELENKSALLAVDEVRSLNAQLRKRVSALEEELTYYQRVMNPIRNDKGLRIDTVEIEKTVDERRFWINVVLTQLGKQNRTPIRGGLSVKLEGSSKGEKKVYQLSALQEKNDLPDIKFRFRYFQEISEEFVLPEGFVVEKVLLSASSSGRKTMQIAKEEPWPFQLALKP
jgi:hypothetical protein